MTELDEKRGGAWETAVNGTITGLGGGVAMLGYLVWFGHIVGAPPRPIISRFDPSGRRNTAVGLLVHSLASVLFGLAFAGLVRGSAPRHGAGALYGALLWVLARGAWLPLLRSNLLSVPQFQFAIAHLVYGVTAVQLLRRLTRRR